MHPHRSEASPAELMDPLRAPAVYKDTMRFTSVLLLIGSIGLAEGCASADTSADKPPESEGARLLGEFNTGQRRLPAGDGSSYLVGTSPGPCAELPAARPPGFQINYRLRDGGAPDRMPPRFALAETECEVIWGQLHLGKPEVRCMLFGPVPSNQIYGELRSLTPHMIKTRTIDASPHRGGYTIEWHWPGHACTVSDSGDVEVVSEDEARFRSMLDWLVGACTSAGNTRCR